jgi:hypothetical protein
MLPAGILVIASFLAIVVLSKGVYIFCILKTKSK